MMGRENRKTSLNQQIVIGTGQPVNTVVDKSKQAKVRMEAMNAYEAAREKEREKEYWED